MKKILKIALIGCFIVTGVQSDSTIKCNNIQEFEPNSPIVKYYSFIGKWQKNYFDNGCVGLSTTDKSAFSKRINSLIDTYRRDKIIRFGSLYIVVKYDNGRFIKATLRKPR